MIYFLILKGLFDCLKKHITLIFWRHYYKLTCYECKYGRWEDYLCKQSQEAEATPNYRNEPQEGNWLQENWSVRKSGSQHLSILQKKTRGTKDVVKTQITVRYGSRSFPESMFRDVNIKKASLISFHAMWANLSTGLQI